MCRERLRDCASSLLATPARASVHRPSEDVCASEKVEERVAPLLKPVVYDLPLAQSPNIRSSISSRQVPGGGTVISLGRPGDGPSIGGVGPEGFEPSPHTAREARALQLHHGPTADGNVGIAPAPVTSGKNEKITALSFTGLRRWRTPANAGVKDRGGRRGGRRRGGEIGRAHV